MKSMLQFFAAAACAVALTACGGGVNKTPTTPAIVQPAFKVTTTATGSGAVVEAGDLVVINYTGYLYDATKADFKGAKVESSVDRQAPASFTVGVGAVPTGWDQSLLGMQPGGKVTAIIPGNMAYGNSTRDATTVNGISYPAIPAMQPLVYDFEMLNVTKATIITPVPPPTTLKTQDVVVGTGTAVASGKTVTVRYAGYLYDGTRVNLKGAKFDDNLGSSDAVLTVNVGGTGTITGFNTGIIGMQVGGTRTVIIPPDLGYGATAQAAGKYGIGIPANSTLVFDITLVSIQ